MLTIKLDMCLIVEMFYNLFYINIVFGILRRNIILKLFLLITALFIRIFVFAFVAVLLDAFDFSSLSDESKLFSKLFYILALIAFIKSAPKFIDNLFGTSISKGSGSSSLSYSRLPSAYS